jgi:hypothetical protein
MYVFILTLAHLAHLAQYFPIRTAPIAAYTVLCSLR